MTWYPDDCDSALDDYYEDPSEDYEDEDQPYYGEQVPGRPYYDIPDDALYLMAMEGDIIADMEIYSRQNNNKPFKFTKTQTACTGWSLVIAGILFVLICLFAL